MPKAISPRELIPSSEKYIPQGAPPGHVRAMPNVVGGWLAQALR